MLVPALVILAIVLLVLGFLHVIGLLIAVALAVVCVVLALAIGGTFGTLTRRP